MRQWFLNGLIVFLAVQANAWEILPAGSNVPAEFKADNGFMLTMINKDGKNNYVTVMDNPAPLDYPQQAVSFEVKGDSANGNAVLSFQLLIERNGIWQSFETSAFDLKQTKKYDFNLATDLKAGTEPGVIRQLKFILRSSDEPQGKKSTIAVSAPVFGAAAPAAAPAVTAPATAPVAAAAVASDSIGNWQLLDYGSNHGKGKVTPSASGFTAAIQNDPADSNYVIILTNPDQLKAAAQKKLTFRYRGKADYRDCSLGIQLIVLENGQWAGKPMQSVKVDNSEWKTAVFALDSDFKLGDATWEIKQIKFVLNSSPLGPNGACQVEVENVRIVDPDQLSAAGSEYIVTVMAQKKSPDAGKIAPVKVFFDFDNIDREGTTFSRITNSEVVDNISPVGFRELLLENTGGLFAAVDTPQAADVVVSSTLIPSAAGYGDRPVIVYRNYHDSPVSLSWQPLKSYAPRRTFQWVDPSHALAQNAALQGGDYGAYFKAEPLPGGTVIARFSDGTPAVVRRANVLFVGCGLGSSPLASGVFYDKLLLRSILWLGNRDLSILTQTESAALAAKAADIQKKLQTIVPADPGAYRLGMSEDNFGRFGWLIGEGLLCSNLFKDLTVENQGQSYRFNVDESVSVPLDRWHYRALSGDLQFVKPPAGDEVNPTEMFRGLGVMEYTIQVEIPESWRGKKLYFEAKNGIDDLDQTYFNDQLIGRTGKETPFYYMAPRKYLIPADLIRFGQTNTLRVCVENTYAEGMFVGKPVLTASAPGAAAAKLAVESVDWVGKRYRISGQNSEHTMKLSLLAPFIAYRFEQKTVSLSQENIIEKIAYQGKNGLKIIDGNTAPELIYDCNRDGAWRAPWLFLYRTKNSQPLLLVFEKQPESISIRKFNRQIDGLSITGDGPLQTVIAGWPFGVTARDMDDFPMSQIDQAVQIALNLPVGCDEAYRIDRAKQQVEIVNRFRYLRTFDQWRTPVQNMVWLPPMIGFALRQKLLVDASAPADFNIMTKYGPLLGKRDSDTIAYRIDLPEMTDMEFAGNDADPQMIDAVNDIFGAAAKFSAGGGVKFEEWTPERPSGRLPGKNVDPFAWQFGLSTALQGYFFLQPDNRQTLENRVRARYLEPLELYQYKNFARHRQEPFSGLNYPILFNSTYPLSVNYEPGQGSTVNYGDANEACTHAVWIGQQLGDFFGQSGAIKSNWHYFRYVMRYAKYTDDYAFHTSSCRESGVGAWIDMLNCEYANWVYYSRLAAMAGDREEQDEAVYRAAKRAVPTLLRWRFAGKPNEFVTGFAENEGVKIETVATGDDLKPWSLFDFSQGIPPVQTELYQHYMQPEIRRYLAMFTFPQKPEHYLDMIVMVNALYGDDVSRLADEARLAVRLQAKSLKQDWPGLRTASSLSAALWRLNGRISLTGVRTANLRQAFYASAARQLTVELDATSDTQLSVSSDFTAKSVTVNGKPVKTDCKPLPLVVGKNTVIVQY